MAENALAMRKEEAPHLAVKIERVRGGPAFVAGALILPAVIYLCVVFVFPIAGVFYRAVSNTEVSAHLPLTAKSIGDWSGDGLPGDAVAGALIADLKVSDPSEIASIARVLNDRIGGYRTLMIKTRRAAADLPSGSGMAALARADARWRDSAYWRALRGATRTLTPYYVLAALDLRQAPDGSIEAAPAEQRIYLEYLVRTFWICGIVTLACALIGYPVAYFISQSKATAQKLMIFALLIPFWTSVLVRTAAWVILLQKNGVINEALTGLGVVSAPMTILYNRFAVYVAMIHVLLPFMVLPIYSVMKSIPPHFVRAALSLGATPGAAFRRVYLPLSLPGLTAGMVMVFILGLGYYVTPALVGGSHDQMESGLIANFALDQGNWQMASAVSFVLLVLTCALCLVARRFLSLSALGNQPR